MFIDSIIVTLGAEHFNKCKDDKEFIKRMVKKNKPLLHAMSVCDFAREEKDYAEKSFGGPVQAWEEVLLLNFNHLKAYLVDPERD